MADAMKRILIINADDLGYTRGVNRAIGRCVTEGALRNATLMANGAAFQDAVAGIKSLQLPAQLLGVGVHLVLTELSPVARAQDIPDLLDAQGRLPRSPEQLFAGLWRGEITERSLFKELDQQVAKVVDHGIRPTHLDSHKHVHVLPRVLKVVIEIARKYSIRWIRQPFDRTRTGPTMRVIDRNNRTVFLKQHVKARLIEIYRPHFLRRIRLAGLHTPDAFYGISLTGIWNEKTMVQLVRQLPAGTNEWMLHPADCDPELCQQRTRLRKEREIERDLLLSPVLKDLLNQYGVALKSYGESL